MAYAFIGLAAGAELRLTTLRGRWKSIVLLIVCTTAVVMTGVGTFFFGFARWAGFLGDLAPLQVLAVAGVVGVIAAARSPSSAIAIISETGAKGAFSETILGVSVAMDVLVICLFSAAIAFADLAFAPEQGLDLLFMLTLSGGILVSIVLGVALGAVMALYLKHEGPQVPLVIAGTCFLVYRCSEIAEAYLERSDAAGIHLEPLLICAAAGFVVQNVTRHGERLVEAMDGVALPVYVLFFTMAGARLDLGALAATWTVALAVAGCRIAMIGVGTRMATALAGDPPSYRRNAWLGFVTQAGLSLALIAQIDTGFAAWGSELATILVAVVAINQLVGPAAFKLALERVGEVRIRRRVWRTAS
jgi:Kef-type K+ transport system membrane component KefB